MGPARALIGLILVTGWYLASGALAAGLLWLGLFCLENLGAAFDQGMPVFTVVFWAMPAALGIGVLVLGNTVRSALPLAPVREGSLPVSRAEAPALWHMVDRLAERMDARPPAQIRLTMDANAAAVERTALLGLLGGKRVLYVGAPLLITLDTDELRAVIAHELGHDAARHTRFSALTIRVTHALDATLKAARADLEANDKLRMYRRLALAPLTLFAAVYNNTVPPARREHEFAADRAAAEVVGTEAMVRALHAYHAANCSWHGFTKRLLRPSLTAGVIPDDPFAAFAAIVDQPHYRQGLRAFQRRPLPFVHKEGPNPHPSLTERAKRLLAGERTGAPSSAEPAHERLDEAVAVASLLARTPWTRSEAFRVAGRRRIVPWPQWLSSIGESASASQVDQLLYAVARLTPGGQIRKGVPPRLVFQALESLRQQLVQHQATAGRQMTRSAAESWLAGATSALVQRLLVADGLATWRVRWVAVVEMDCPVLGRRELRSLVNDVLRGKDGEAKLCRRLEDLGLDLETAVAPIGPVPSVLPAPSFLSAQYRSTTQQRKAPLEVRAARMVTGLAFACLTITCLTHL